ncbi:aminoacyl-tRNA hydrolase [Tsukamurella paurometabola]|uniref:peptidyl-tRNA hydrolase n=1 Tax=Tsukamurella paurometabola TaxID=2061 RepID=A0ABS5NEG1_TSUPA|nr:aminoacyl-tRNA hydrolase [Tsukamurella paurometabola]MBS4102415.1 aminoacyl-tRNA hydrolase [Tsukamurella paurometabola]
MKQIIVMRKDLSMRAGKMVAQGAHASMKATLANQNDPRVQQWLSEAFTKVCVRVDSLEELRDVQARAVEAGLIVAEIEDNGLTEFHGEKTVTCCAIGPDTHDALAPVTEHLKLL